MLSSSLTSGISTNSTSPYLGESPLQPLPPLYVPNVPPEESRYDGVDLRGTNETEKLSEPGSYFSPTEVLEQYQEFIDYIKKSHGIAGYTIGNILDSHKKLYTFVLGFHQIILEYLKKKTDENKDFIFSYLCKVLNELKWMYLHYQFVQIDKNLMDIFGKLLLALFMDKGNNDDINAIIRETNEVWFFDTIHNNEFKKTILTTATLILNLRSIYRRAPGYRNLAMFGHGPRKKSHTKYTKKKSLLKKRRKIKKRRRTRKQ